MSVERLSLPEWAIIATLCGAMLGIGIASLPPQTPPFPFKNNLIDISIVGAVAEPGAYRVPAHTTIRQALGLTTLLTDANVQKCKWEARVRQGQVIRVARTKQRKNSRVVAKVKALPDQKEAKKRKKTKKSDSSIVENSQV